MSYHENFKVKNSYVTSYKVLSPELRKKNLGFKILYRNKDTVALDKKFDLKGGKIDDLVYAQIFYDAVNVPGIGDDCASKLLMSYFIDLAIKMGSFFGVSMEEMQEKFLDTLLDIDKALYFRDSYNGHKKYFKILKVDGKDALFPMNLKPLKPVKFYKR